MNQSYVELPSSTILEIAAVVEEVILTGRERIKSKFIADERSSWWFRVQSRFLARFFKPPTDEAIWSSKDWLFGPHWAVNSYGFSELNLIEKLRTAAAHTRVIHLTIHDLNLLVRWLPDAERERFNPYRQKS